MIERTYYEADLLLTYFREIKFGQAYVLVSKTIDEDKIVLIWESEIELFLTTTMVKFPGSLSYQRLRALLTDEELKGVVPKIIKEVFYKCEYSRNCPYSDTCKDKDSKECDIIEWLEKWK